MSGPSPLNAPKISIGKRPGLTTSTAGLDAATRKGRKEHTASNLTRLP